MPTDEKNRSFIGHYSKESSAIPGVYNGMRVEVLNSGNELLFMADVQVLNEHMIELVRTSEAPRYNVEDGQSVSIRGFNAYQNRGVHMTGRLSRLAQHQNEAWLVKDLNYKGSDLGRFFSRQPIQAQAWVLPEGAPESSWLACRVINASAGGVCFRTAEPLEAGDRLSIRFRLRPGKEQPPLAIAIRRVTDCGTEFEYGSEFVDLSSEVDAIITKTIIQLQIMQ